VKFYQVAVDPNRDFMTLGEYPLKMCAESKDLIYGVSLCHED